MVQPKIALDMPEKVWTAYIDFEVENGKIGKARELYQALLQRTKHVKVWASFAKFEADQARSVGRVRDIMDLAQNYFRDSQPEQKEERKMLLETWIQIEKGFGDLDYVANIKEKLPIKVQKRRTLAAPNETATQADGVAD